MAQYGSAPAPLGDPASARAAARAAPPPAPAPRASLRLQPLRDHALHRLRQRDDEPEGFGAYTYVLVGTGVARDSAGVRTRLARLLSALQNLAPAHEVAAAARQVFNVFVVPAAAAAPAAGSETLDIDLRLAQSLLLHAPAALHLQPETSRALQQRNGPFLLTLPGRLAAAGSDTPVLFADLSVVPEVAVVDVVRQYMGDMLQDFRRDNPAWKPPQQMQLAVALVRLVQGTGDLVHAVFGPGNRP